LMASEGWSFKEFKEIFVKWDEVFKYKGWGTVYLGNHDFPRMVSRWGNDSANWREISSKMLTTFLLTMRGTPYYYFGDELGMSNIRFENVEDYRDIMTINLHKLIESEGGDLDEFMESQKLIGRDNGRTPFQWDANENAGFTSGKPWLKINPNYTEINAEAQEKDENSPLNYFRKLIKFRKENPALIYGKAEYYDLENENIFAYTREFEGRKLLILVNFTETTATANVPFDLSNAKVLFGNYDDFDGKLKPYQAVILEIS
jgi:oligo-1,6-glucosidase